MFIPLLCATWAGKLLYSGGISESMDDVALANMMAGHLTEPVNLGAAGRDIARSLGVSIGQPIWLSHYTYLKTTYSHPKVTFQDYKKIPFIMRFGAIYRSPHRISINIWYFEGDASHTLSWRLGIKRTAKNGLFVGIFQDSNMKEVRRTRRQALKRDALIRDFPTQMAQRLGRRATAA